MQKNFKQMQEEPIVMVNGFPIRYDMTLMSYRDLKMMRGNTSLEKWTSSLCTTGGKKTVQPQLSMQITCVTLNTPESFRLVRGKPAILCPWLRCSIVQQCNVKFCTAHFNGGFKDAYTRRFSTLTSPKNKRRTEVNCNDTRNVQQIVKHGLHANHKYSKLELQLW